jgi:uncharacterized protein YegL
MDVRGQLWPVYVVADESGSMYPHMGELDAGLRSIHQELLARPMAAAKVRLTVVGFSDDAVVRAHLVDIRDESELPPLVGGSNTNYSAAFDALRKAIPEDVATLKSRHYGVYRPAVFFLSDGLPNHGGSWQEAHASLVDRAATPGAPNIIAFGIGDAEAEVIREVATQPYYAFIAIPGSDIGKNIAEFFTALTRSIVASTQTLGGGRDSLIVEPPPGFIPLDQV